MNYWQRWIGDWKRKTAHLSAEAKGIYGELLDHIYATHAPLPADREQLYRVAGASSASERKTTDQVVREFFTECEGGYTNKRAAEEISRRESYSAAQSERARKRWEHAEPVQRANGAHKAEVEDTSPIVERIPMIGGEEFEVRESFAAELARLYPAVDIPATLRQMRGWCLGNPQRLKTPRGIRKFITGWCERDQNG